MQKPKPIDEEVIVRPKKMIVSNTNSRGIIWGVNHNFIEISGYSFDELKGSNHNIIRHPDMPKIIFKLLWNRILAGKHIFAFVKNLRKDGKYYWVVADFEIMFKRDNPDEIYKFYAYRKAAPRNALKEIIPLYQKLLEMEQEGGMEESGKYLNNYLKKKNLTYDEYVLSLIRQKSGGFFAKVAKSLFG